MRGKREFVARACAQTGITKVLEKLPQRSVLIILNYHRVGDAAETPFDSGTFSATPAELDLQIRYFQSRFEMATLETALAMLNGEAPRRTSVLITLICGSALRDCTSLTSAITRPFVSVVVPARLIAA